MWFSLFKYYICRIWCIVTPVSCMLSTMPGQATFKRWRTILWQMATLWRAPVHGWNTDIRPWANFLSGISNYIEVPIPSNSKKTLWYLWLSEAVAKHIFSCHACFFSYCKSIFWSQMKCQQFVQCLSRLGWVRRPRSFFKVGRGRGDRSLQHHDAAGKSSSDRQSEAELKKSKGSLWELVGMFFLTISCIYLL